MRLDENLSYLKEGDLVRIVQQKEIGKVIKAYNDYTYKI